MAANPMRAIGRLEARDLFLAERDVERSQCVVDVLKLGRSHDRRDYGRFCQQPGERELRRRRAAVNRGAAYRVDDVEIGRLVQTVGKWIRTRAHRLRFGFADASR